MVAEVMLINPRRKRRSTKVRRNPRRRMSALQRKYFGGGGAKRRRRRSTAIVARSNPIRRRRRRHVIRARRNPISARGMTGSIKSALVPAAIGAAGAVALNFGWTKFGASLPASVQTGPMATVAQIAIGLALGFAVGKVAGRTVGAQVAAGAVTVTIFTLAQSYMSGAGLGGSNAGGYTYSGDSGSYFGAMAGLGRRHKRMGRYVGMNGNLPRGLNGMNRYVGMNGNLPRGLNGLAAAANPAMVRRRMNRGRMGYIGPARTVGPH